MKSWAISIVWLLTVALLVVPAPCADPPANRQNPRQEVMPGAAQTSKSLTGCIDERDGSKYVLVDAASRSIVAELKAEGFPNEGFAKHLGHKVKIQGRNASEQGRTVFNVRKIDTLSDSCAPPPAAQ